MKYNSIISAIKEKLKFFPNKQKKLACPFIPSTVRTIIKSKKGAKDMYCVLIKNCTFPSGAMKWNTIVEVSMQDWKQIFRLPFIITKNTKLQWLQYRINHRILA